MYTNLMAASTTDKNIWSCRWRKGNDLRHLFLYIYWSNIHVMMNNNYSPHLCIHYIHSREITCPWGKKSQNSPVTLLVTTYYVYIPTYLCMNSSCIWTNCHMHSHTFYSPSFTDDGGCIISCMQDLDLRFVVKGRFIIIIKKNCNLLTGDVEIVLSSMYANFRSTIY